MAVAGRVHGSMSLAPAARCGPAALRTPLVRQRAPCRGERGHPDHAFPFCGPVEPLCRGAAARRRVAVGSPGGGAWLMTVRGKYAALAVMKCGAARVWERPDSQKPRCRCKQLAELSAMQGESLNLSAWLGDCCLFNANSKERFGEARLPRLCTIGRFPGFVIWCS